MLISSVSKIADVCSFFNISANSKFNLKKSRLEIGGSKWGGFMKKKTRGRKSRGTVRIRNVSAVEFLVSFYLILRYEREYFFLLSI